MLFIAVYLHFYLAVYMHRAMGLRWRVAWLGIPLFFAASLSLRQLDMPLCSDWRWGTRFAWHALNAVTLGFTAGQWFSFIWPSVLLIRMLCNK